MKITSSAAVTLLSTLPSLALVAGQCVTGGFEFEFDGACTADAVVQAYADQIFNAPGGVPSDCTSDAKTDLEAKLAAMTPAMTLDGLCTMVYDNQNKVAFTSAANRGTDSHFEKMFYDGRTDWQEEVETRYESPDMSRTSILKEDAEAVRTFFDGIAQGRRVDWPGTLSNFQSPVKDANDLATCTTNAAMCCWPKDRQAGDNNGNCNNEEDLNCVNKNPGDNTNLCYVDMNKGNDSTHFDSDGIVDFPEDNDNGEGAIHCHGLAWANDVNDHTARYKANNLFFVSMYDHMYVRGYVKNIPGAPMCGCVEQMPTVSRSDCTQVDLTETVLIQYDTTNFMGKLTRVHVDFNACKGIDNRNNDLWAYMARLYNEGKMTPAQFGEAGRIVTDRGCTEAERYELNEKGLTRGYDHDVEAWTLVAGRDDLYDGHAFGRESFNLKFFDHSLTAPDEGYDVATPFPQGQTPIIMRICASCTKTHKRIFYRRLTPIADPNFNLLHNILYHRSWDGQVGNRWNTDFTLHSTYEDAVEGTNAWGCPVRTRPFNYWAPFTGECSPTGARVTNQYSIWNWYPGPRSDVAYYVNSPDGAGIEALDLTSSLRFNSLHTDVDLGSVAVEGRVFEAEGNKIHITGSGAYIGYNQDNGHYLSEIETGDIDVKVRVSSFSGSMGDYAKAGIMLRSDNERDSVFAMGFLSGRQGVAMNVRNSKGAWATRPGSYHKVSMDGKAYQTAAWLRLVKKMERVEFYRSDNGVDWILQASADNVLFPGDTFRVGLAVTSNSNGNIAEAIFENYGFEEYLFPTSAPSLSAAPTPWNEFVNVGEGTKAGRLNSYDENTGVTQYLGYGTGIWGSSDSFFYHNTQRVIADGAFDVVTYTNQFHTGYTSAKGGIMIRDSNDADAAHAFIGVSGYYTGVTFVSRGSAGAITDHHQTSYVTNQQAWIRLSKPADSNVITASYKKNEADEWIVMGSTTVNFTGHALQVGTAVTAATEDGNGYVWFYTKGYEVIESPGSRKQLRA